jgi:predicted dehydrogenase
MGETDSPGKKLRVAFIGTGGMGAACIGSFAEEPITCPCYADVDKRNFSAAAQRWPNAKAFQDYREMFDKMHDEFDAVVICTPDHSHYPATVLAMKHEKAVYTQKPLTHTVWEARQLTEAAKTYKYATQMGIQLHAHEGWRILYEWIHQDAIGDVQEIHVWSDRPGWPQGIDRPDGSDPVPADFDWKVWLGPAPERPFKNGVYHPGKWRGWTDFGCGALGDMGCHMLDGMFWAMEPGYPTSIEPVTLMPMHKETFPKASTVKWTFPANGKRPGFVAYWYDGGLRPARPADLEPGRELPESGALYIGTKGTILGSADDGASVRIIPERKLHQIGKPKRMLERSPGHYREFVMVALGEKPLDFCKANFNYSAPMTETIQLANLALRLGRRIEWDGPNLKITNIPEANALLTKAYTDGWKF